MLENSVDFDDGKGAGVWGFMLEQCGILYNECLDRQPVMNRPLVSVSDVLVHVQSYASKYPLKRARKISTQAYSNQPQGICTHTTSSRSPPATNPIHCAPAFVTRL